MAILPLEPEGRALLGILAHALGQPEEERVLTLSPGELGLTAASPGAASVAFASLDVPAREATRLAGNYRPQPPPRGELGDVELKREKGGLVLAIPAGRVQMEEIGGDPIDPGWIWPAEPAALEAVVRRDALLEALPRGEGEIRYVAADKQLALVAGRDERRLALANRPRRRKEIAAAVDFDELRLAVAGAGDRVTLGLGDRRPLTVESTPLRAVLVRTAARWRPVEAIREAGRADAARTKEPKRRQVADRGGQRERDQREEQRKRLEEARRRAAAHLEAAIGEVAGAEAELQQAGAPPANLRKVRERIEKLAADLR
jgi:hypothetical protein